MITIKTNKEIELMAEGGKRLAVITKKLTQAVKPGIKTADIESLAVNLINHSGGESTFLGFHGYPAATCISINDEVVHGIPGTRTVKEGDIVGIDIGLRYQEFCTDTATTIHVGETDPQKERLIRITRQSLFEGLKQVKPGNRISDIGATIQSYVEKFGLGIVRDLTGHGIGRQLHEEPAIPNFGTPGRGSAMQEGMTLAIEPMVTLGNPAVKQLADGWTIVTLDHSPAAHFEHTIAVTKNGYRILTQ